MTTLLLQSVGGALGGGAFGPLGAAIGRTLGTIAGSVVDNALFGKRGTTRMVDGPRLTELAGLASTEGAPVPRVYGRARIGGALIWATRFEEVATTEQQTSGGATGGKSLGSVVAASVSSGSPGTTTATTSYSYFANLAVGLCEGPIAFVRRIWADGTELDLTRLTVRIYRGDGAQQPDPLILAKEGAGFAPAYRGLAYVVFERLPLAAFGNRIPQLSFEVVRAVSPLAAMVRAVNLIPGCGEFAYDTLPVTRVTGYGTSSSENRHVLTHGTDWDAALDALQALCPRLERVSLVVSWFGDDLRAGACSVAPRADLVAKETSAEWSVAGRGRATARAISLVDGKPAYGGTPSDLSVLRAIRDLKARGIAVTLYPFILMDVPPGNRLPDPWTGATGQPPFPWRGRITCDPGPGRPGTADGGAAAASQIAGLFGKAARTDFAVAGDGVGYRGPAEWSIRRQILHYAHLTLAAGGVDAFLIGSELVGLTRVRGPGGSFPAVDALVALAADVKAVLGPATKVAYAADWTEYGGQAYAGGELRFPLDRLWASPAIDAVGIDFYPPLSDWRDRAGHADAATAQAIYDRDYLTGRFGAGEAFDWFYASETDRRTQTRTPITDGAYGKPWVWRQKDLVSWWSERHVERAGGKELAQPTAWVPRSKPVWLTEFGCPAVDKGPNRPSAFPDPKSSEGQLPPFSRATRDDLVQERALEAVHRRFDPAVPGFAEAGNPLSAPDGLRMVDPGRTALWAYDARPFPAFPDQAASWADSANWETGHWLNGRLEGAPLDGLIAALLADFGAPAAAEIAVDGWVEGYVVDRPMSLRDALEPLMPLAGFDAVDGAGALRFVGRRSGPVSALGLGDLVPERDGSLVALERTEDSALPREVRLAFTDAAGDYRRAAVASRRLAGATAREASADLAAVMERGAAQRLADIWLHDLWAGRETATFQIRPSLLALEPGDLVTLPAGSAGRLYRITAINDAGPRRVTARAVDPAAWQRLPAGLARPTADPPALPGPPAAVVIDWPGAAADPPVLQSLAVFASPWTGPATLWRSADGASFEKVADIAVPARIGTLLSDLPPGPAGRWDLRSGLDLALSGGSLAGQGDLAALDGRAALAVRGADGRWEVLGFARAELTGERSYRLTRLARGLIGSEAQAAAGARAGSMAVVIDAALVPLASGANALGQAWRWRVAPAGRSHGDPSAVAFEAGPKDAPLRPLAPVRLVAQRGPAGVAFRWIRRGRIDADAWEPLDIPLGETSESYVLDLLAGGAVRRSLTAGEPAVLYPAAAELADFGAAQTLFSVRLCQLSASVGRGVALETVVPVT